MEDFEKRVESLKKRLEEIKKLKEEFEKLRKKGVYVEPVEFKFYSTELLILVKKVERFEKLLKDIVSLLENIVDLMYAKQPVSIAQKEESKEIK